eukprot:CAMPEP_0171475720 /NCGR_PEP_ID=MMETSP0946-20130122/3161_1 /TAXON_ID=109269 /ORGANISM="Vaucheria litorea, Strain CCMP2940" /LENGTH=356 /DNA_ID=CAMNT_0012005841 /DNA_START=46 /DNA_END=1113 /DNA_ORIENTATION=-
MANPNLKYASLGLLVLQNSSLVLLMSYSRNQSGPMYLSSTAVALNEVVKVLVCLLVIFMTTGGWKQLVRTLQIEIIQKPIEMAKLTVPSFLYMVQNNLLYEALSTLDPATYSVCYQLKIMTTALFSVILLKKKMTSVQWISLVMLTVGVALAEFSTHSSADPLKAEKEKIEKNLVGEGMGEENPFLTSKLTGFVCVLAAACTSGFAGVYFEMILKGAKTSLWIRNIQMGLPSILFALVSVYTKDFAKVNGNGFFHGYNFVVWGVIALQAIGGLVVAVVVKYADNILKAFASAVSIITSCILSAFFFQFRPSMMFVMGSSLVTSSVFMYSNPKLNREKRRKQSPLPYNNKNKDDDAK